MSIILIDKNLWKDLSFIKSSFEFTNIMCFYLSKSPKFTSSH